MTGVSATWMPLSGHLAADEAGSDDAPRFVFLHGFAQTRESWKPIAERLVDHGATCVVIDLPGHGGSGSVRADLRRTADMAVEIGHRATWVGYSLGGRAALHVALMYPHLVRSLVLIGANPGIDDEDERARRRADDDRLAARIHEIGIEAFLDEWTALPLFGGRTVTADERADRSRNTADGLANSLRLAGTGAQDSLWPRLRELNMPVLALAGDRDTKFSAIARQLADAAPRGEWALVPGAAHAAHLERPDEVVELIRSFSARA